MCACIPFLQSRNATHLPHAPRATEHRERVGAEEEHVREARQVHPLARLERMLRPVARVESEEPPECGRGRRPQRRRPRHPSSSSRGAFTEARDNPGSKRRELVCGSQ